MNLSAHILASVASAPNMFFVAGLGIGTVLLGLTCIIFLTEIMHRLVNRSQSTEEAPVQPAVPVPQAQAAVPAVPAEIPNRAEILAAVTAVIAEELGTDVSAIRVHSFRRIDGTVQAGATASPARSEMIAAVSAALAEELGTDVSAIRIHSFKPIG